MEDNVINTKLEFINLIKKFNEAKRLVTDKLMQHLDVMKENNKEVLKLIHDYNENSSKSLTPLSSTFLTTQQVAQTTMQACDEHLVNKLAQIRQGNQAIECRMQEETERSQKALYEIMNKDDVALKPYEEVVCAKEQLLNETEILNVECEELKQKALEIEQNLKSQQAQVSAEILNLELIFNKSRLEVSMAKQILNDQLFSLNLSSINDVNMNSAEIEKLTAEIVEKENKLLSLQGQNE